MIQNGILGHLRRYALCAALALACTATAQDKNLAPTPPMGWMSWNLFKDNISDRLIREMADAMVAEGYKDAGYEYIFIDDCWQGGRDNRNNLIPDPKKFPNGMKALADYVHSKGLKLGIYSDAAQLTCAGYTASYGFEEQDAKTFASWGIDFLKYDYCNAPEDLATAKHRYATMATALRHSGRDIALNICEWGPRQPWHWAASVGGQSWRCTYDVRDMWRDIVHQGGMGILDIINQTDTLWQYAGPGHWNDLDMLVVGLYGKGGPSSDLGGVGCTNDEYQTQMSMWCMLSSQLALTNDLRQADAEARRVLLNREAIAINQDTLGQVARPMGKVDGCRVYLRELTGNRHALAILNDTDEEQPVQVKFKALGLGTCKVRDIWQHRNLGKRTAWKGKLRKHQTVVLVLEHA